MAAASSPAPRKFPTESVKVNPTPISSAVALSVASSDPWNGASALSKASTAAASAVSVVGETLQVAASVLDAAPEDARPSSVNSPQSPTD